VVYQSAISSINLTLTSQSIISSDFPQTLGSIMQYICPTGLGQQKKHDDRYSGA
jgi:hypothetical protein